jgi:hypothetical protein
MTQTTPRLGGRVRAAFLAGSWCLVALGGGHLTFMATTLVHGSGGQEQRTLQAMAATAASSLLGIPRNLLALFYGFSAAMALLAMAVGAVNLAAERLAPEVLTRGTGLLRLDLAVSLLALAVSVLAFPAPAVAILTLACAAYTAALIGAVRHTRSNRPPRLQAPQCPIL